MEMSREEIEKTLADFGIVYNKRAHIENAIKELKEDYQLGKIVTDSFDANDVITQTTMMAFIIKKVKYFKSWVLEPPNLEVAA